MRSSTSPIDDGEIDCDRGCHVQPRQTVRGDIDAMSDFPQRLRQIIARDFVVFNDQNVHEAYLTDVEPVFVGTISFTFRGVLQRTLSSGHGGFLTSAPPYSFRGAKAPAVMGPHNVLRMKIE
jgi:hypothetical protein